MVGLWHEPLEHSAPADAQMRPQPPQLAPSSLVSTQTPPHAVCDGGQAEVQAESMHDCPRVQAPAQEPQWVGSSSETHAVPQNSLPSSQVQAPATHAWNDPQAFAHPPQFAGSLPTSVHPFGSQYC
jgi:hypothetical protein